jgi:tetratricopeptide (TPR) repeat protein
MKSGNWKNAKTLFESGIRCSPNHGALWHAYASMEARRGNLEHARSLFAKGITNSPLHVALFQGWAALELRAEDYSAAKTLITQALTLNKRNGRGWMIAAEIEDKQGNVGLASLLLRRGIECAPSSVILYKQLGSLLLSKGRINSAREVFQQGILIDPLYAPLYHALAELEASIFNIEGLSKLNKQAMKFFSGNAMIPTPNSSSALEARMRGSRSHQSIPHGVATLAQRIVEDDSNREILSTNFDPHEVLENIISDVGFEETILHFDVS